jgi:tetratricopeptide (TPR) repeat protein
LDELRVTATFSTVGDALDTLLAYRSATDLIHRIVSRWSEQFGQPLAASYQWAPDDTDHPNDLVSSTLCFILACKHGVSERELLDLLGVKRQAVATFFHHLHGVMQLHQGLLSFAHVTFSDAVRQLYMTDNNTKQALHVALGSYFQQSQHAVARRCQEVPHHLQRAGRTEDLTEFMCKQEVFEHFWETESRRLAMTVVWQHLPCEHAYTSWLHDLDTIALKDSAPSLATTRLFALRLYKMAQALHWMGQFLKAFDFYLWALVAVLKQSVVPYSLVRHGQPSPRTRSTPVAPTDLRQRKHYKKRRPEEEPDFQLIEELMGVAVDVPTSPSLPISDAECPTVEQVDSFCVFACLVLESFGRLCAHQSHHNNAIMLYQRARELRSEMDGPSAVSTTAVLGNLAWSLIVRKAFFGSQGAATLLKTAIVNECTVVCEQDGLNLPPTDATNDKLPRIDRCELNHPDWNALLDHLAALCHQPGGSHRISRVCPPFVNRLALINTTLENFIVAQRLFNLSLDLHIACFGPRHPATATVYYDLGLLYLAQLRKSRKSSSQPPSPAATSASTSSPPPRRELPRSVSVQPKAAQSGRTPRLRSVPTMTNDSDRFVDLAMTALDQALGIRAETLGKQHTFYSTVLISKADVYVLQNNKDKARSMYEQALAIRVACFGSDSRAVEAVQNRLNSMQPPRNAKNRKPKSKERKQSHS